VYVGEFKGDTCNNKGTLFYPDGKRFEGQWKDGKKNGRGNYVFPNGSIYQVIYREGTKMNQGVLKAGDVNIESLKTEYRSLAKKSQFARDFLDETIGKKFMEDAHKFKKRAKKKKQADPYAY